ncbi:MAG: ATP-binding protein [Okeania sp. SIO3B5]|uniref:ATP-dependent nuclease n=1 Tax=Okeania sp. SIO3B5 TaxID=2607811 RepID=UPI001400E9A0|nr:AAA family ATPase [Okeania sp. SIO3B5]NEO55007.1 ATP-binding protein [Okeania sp. SIO3B5]
MRNELLENITNQLKHTHLITLIGENMSGKSTLIKELRQYISRNSVEENIFTLQVDAPQNRIIFTAHNSNALEIRIDDLSYVFHKLAQADNTLSDIDTYYERIVLGVNNSIKIFDENVVISFENSESNAGSIRRHLDRILKSNLNIKDISEADDQKVLHWRNSIEQTIMDKTKEIFGDSVEKDDEDKKIIFIDYHSGGRKKLTQVSSGLEILVLLLFIIELIKTFESIGIRFILLIDEPESYLHPTWQEKFLSYVQAKISQNFMVVYATHSQYMVSTNDLDAINIVSFSDDEILCSKLTDLIPEKIDVRRDREINILKPVEDSLGLSLNVFSLPFLTVEGDEELALLHKCAESINVTKIISLKGAGNILPYIQASIMCSRDFRGVFLLDADLKIENYIKGMEDKLGLIDSIKENFLFLGKRIYSFDEVYKLENNNYKLRLEECLEDFIASHFYDNEEQGYRCLAEVAKTVIDEFQNNHSIELNNSLTCLENFTDFKFKVIISCLKNVRYVPNPSLSGTEQKKENTRLHKMMQDRLKTKILHNTLSMDLRKLEPLIQRVNQSLFSSTGNS